MQYNSFCSKHYEQLTEYKGSEYNIRSILLPPSKNLWTNFCTYGCIYAENMTRYMRIYMNLTH